MGLLDRPGQSQRYGLLSPDVMSLIQSGGPRLAPAPAAPRRERVSGWRVLDRVLGGQTVTGGLDAERERLQAEADAPQTQARTQAMRLAAERMGPEAMIAFNTNPEAFGESLGMQFRPVTTAAGSRTTYGPNGGAFAVEQPTFGESGDQTLRRTSAGVEPVYTRTEPSIKEGIDRSVADTGRINALNVPVGPNTDLVDPTTGRQIYQGFRAPEVNSVAPGGSLAVTDPVTGAVINTVQGNARPITAMDRNRIREDEDAVEALGVINSSLGNFLSQVREGDLNLGPLTNRASGVRNWAGQSDQNSRNYASFMAGLEKMRNDSLRLNNGVQTDGDSQRAWNELLANVNDEGVVMQRLAEIQAINERAIAYRRARIADTRDDTAPAAPAQGQPVRIYNDDDYARLPSGATFQGPDGVTRRKP